MLAFWVYLLAKPFALLWVRWSGRSWRRLPQPVDKPSVHAGGDDSDRVLLIGSGMATSYGVMSYELGLGGHLARLLSSITGRGTDVDIVGSHRINASSAPSYLERVDLARYDAVVLTIGGAEALQLMPPAMWRQKLGALFDAIEADAPASLRIFLVGQPNIRSIIRLPPGYAQLVSRRAKALNAEAREAVAGRDQFSFIEFDPTPGDLVTSISRKTYDEWAWLIAPAMSAALDAQVPPTLLPPSEGERLKALEELYVLDTEPEERFDQIIATARDLFGVSGASITFIDRHRQWVKAASGLSRESTPRREALCDITIQRTGLFVVEDLQADERTREKAWAGAPQNIRFYAGYPISAPDGHRVGALCVVDTKPRRFSAEDRELLRDLAISVQSLLWESVSG